MKKRSSKLLRWKEEERGGWECDRLRRKELKRKKNREERIKERKVRMKERIKERK